MVTVYKLGGESGNEFFGASPGTTNSKSIEFFGGGNEGDEGGQGGQGSQGDKEEESSVEECDNGSCDACEDDETEENVVEEHSDDADPFAEEQMDSSDEEEGKVTPPVQSGGAANPNIVNLLSQDPLFMVLTQFLKNKKGENIVEALDNINKNLERLNINLERSANKSPFGKK